MPKVRYTTAVLYRVVGSDDCATISTMTVDLSPPAKIEDVPQVTEYLETVEFPGWKLKQLKGSQKRES